MNWLCTPCCQIMKVQRLFCSRIREDVEYITLCIQSTDDSAVKLWFRCNSRDPQAPNLIVHVSVHGLQLHFISAVWCNGISFLSRQETGSVISYVVLYIRTHTLSFWDKCESVGGPSIVCPSNQAGCIISTHSTPFPSLTHTFAVRNTHAHTRQSTAWQGENWFGQQGHTWAESSLFFSGLPKASSVQCVWVSACV